MEMQSLQQVLDVAQKKAAILQKSRSRFVLRAAMAGMFIGFGVIVAFKTGSFFYNQQSPFTYPVAAFTFGTAIIMIAYGGGDLFTGNAFYFTYAGLRKKLSWLQVLKIWLSSYGGNLVGAVAFAMLIFGTGLFRDEQVNNFLLFVARQKTTAPWMELFYRGILCNWLICLAFFIPMSLKSDGPKLFMMMLFVFGFFISGYEHSIANMCTFAIALVTDQSNSIGFSGILHNLLPVSLGNLAGGGLLMGGMYWYLNNKEEQQ